jgi:hypothetical protein
MPALLHIGRDAAALAALFETHPMLTMRVLDADWEFPHDIACPHQSHDTYQVVHVARTETPWPRLLRALHTARAVMDPRAEQVTMIIDAPDTGDVFEEDLYDYLGDEWPGRTLRSMTTPAHGRLVVTWARRPALLRRTIPDGARSEGV